MSIEKRFCVEECLTISASELSKAGFFKAQPGRLWEIRFKKGTNWIGSVHVRLNFDGKTLTTQYAIPMGRWKKAISLDVPLAPIHTEVGKGTRWLFLCQCGKRVGALSATPQKTFFSCRTCHNLTYMSRLRHRNSIYEAIALPYFRLLKGKRMCLPWGEVKNLRSSVRAFGEQGIQLGHFQAPVTAKIIRPPSPAASAEYSPNEKYEGDDKQMTDNRYMGMGPANAGSDLGDEPRFDEMLIHIALPEKQFSRRDRS